MKLLLVATLLFFSTRVYAENVYNDQGQIIGHTAPQSYFWGTAPDGAQLFRTPGGLNTLSNGIHFGDNHHYWMGQVDDAGNGYLFTYVRNNDGRSLTTYSWDIVHGRFVNPKTEVLRCGRGRSARES